MPPLASSFADVLESTIHRATRRADGIALLFSGGMDSTALLLACMEAAPDRDIVCFTATSEPRELVDRRVQAQLDTSARIAKKLGVRHEYISVDFRQAADQKKFASIQPFDLDIGNWFPAFRLLQPEKNYLFMCGQNADSLSNFGHTAPFLFNGRRNKKMMLGKRILATRQFLDSDRKHLIAPLFEKLFLRSGKYRIARSDQEVFDYFFRPEMYRVPMAFKGAAHESSMPLPPDYRSVSDELFFRNLRGYNDSSLARLFLTTAKISDHKALVPFSSRDLIRYFHHRLHASSTIEQLQGKYQIRRYVNAKVPKSLIQSGYAIEERSNRIKIAMKRQIRHDARQAWFSVLPPPLDQVLAEALDALGD